MIALRSFFAALAAALLAAAFAPLAFGQADPQLEAARVQGVIGERIDGYLGVVGAADPEIIRKVNDINNRRRAVYEETARETGTTVAQVARVAGEKQIADRVRPGEYFMDETGAWKQKPAS